MTAIEDKRIIDKVRSIILAMDNKCLELALGVYAYHDYQHIPQVGIKRIEIDYLFEAI